MPTLVNSSPVTVTNYTDTTAMAGNTYPYVVKAVDNLAISPASNEANATVTNSSATTHVDLSGQFSLTGISVNGSVFSGGLDGAGNARVKPWLAPARPGTA